ncbi:MAG: hypothetical protein ACI4PP_00180 [Clostridia bacterium]
MKCDDCAMEKEMTAEESQTAEKEPEIETEEVFETETCEAESSEEEDERPKVYCESFERDERGLIKRDGFKMKGVYYGAEFEEENLEKVTKFAVGSALFLFIGSIICLVIVLKAIL